MIISYRIKKVGGISLWRGCLNVGDKLRRVGEREYRGVVSKLFSFHISYRTNEVGGDGNTEGVVDIMPAITFGDKIRWGCRYRGVVSIICVIEQIGRVGKYVDVQKSDHGEVVYISN